MSELNVPKEFLDLVRTDDLVGEVSEADRSVTKAIATVADVPDPVAHFFQKAENDKFSVPEIAAAPVHKDGIVVEKSVGGTFHFHYKGGALVKTEIFDPSLPGGREVVEEHATSDVIIETSLAKSIGARQDDQELLEK